MIGGELLVVGFEGPSLTSPESALLRRLDPFGVILFGRNIEDAAQLHGLVGELRRVVPGAVLCLDAEGGPVDRLRSVVGAAPAAARLARQPVRQARRAGRWIGAALHHFGIGIDFAPVVDLDHGACRNALDERYLGSRPGAVTARAGAFLEGLRSAAVEGCLKHFPGLGGAAQDTHFEGSEIDRSRAALADDLAPFTALRDRHAPVMVGHASYALLDRSARPASLSPAIASDLLRGELGFRGVAFSDDLEMKALDRWGSLPERTRAALEAGCDGLLICRRLAEAPAVAEALAAPELASRRRQAGERLSELRRRMASWRPPRRWSLETIRRRLEALDRALPSAQG
ncbi:MAG: glycoside hydrolase family 3 N-terminal domain-containing protein [Acidobacteriota bacterium]